MMVALKANHEDAAMLWVAHILLLMLLLSCESMFVQSAAKPSHGGSGDCIARERRILLQFKAAVNDTRQALSSWNSESNPNCCKWKGVSCDNVTNHVVALSLSCSRLLRNPSVEPSEILATISKLHNLHYLDLSGNFDQVSILDQFSSEDMSLTISIPPEVGGLTQLVFLNLSSIWLPSNSNVIPLQLGNLHALKVLDLSSVSYSISADDQPTVPKFPTKALLSLSNLEDLRLDWISLDNSSNWANSMCKLHHLKILSLTSSGLTGPLPSCLKNLTSLTHLSLNDNDFSGSSIFNIVANMSSLVHLSASKANISHFIPTHTFSSPISYLDLKGNNLQGQFPRSFCYLTFLEYLDFSINTLNGSIPSCLGNLTSLKYLNLSANALTGIISSCLGNLASLEHLDLYKNALNGIIPSFLGNLTSLKYLDLSFNALNGIIPSCLGNLASLEHLDLSENALNGIIPSSLGNLTSLEYLDLSFNALNGIIPSCLGNLTSLEHLDLSKNALNGIIPSSIGNLTSLKYLVLAENTLNGIIPSFLGNLTSLEYLALFENALNGIIPSSLGNLTRLKALLLHDNQLNGFIPSSISLLTSLTHVDLSSNCLTGTFSLSVLKDCAHLEGLSLSHNSLTVNFNKGWSSLMQLQFLSLNTCNMKGGFPLFVAHHPSLVFLSLSGNNFVGSIPSWIWKFQNLKFLDLSLNKFTGFIPSDMRSMRELAILDLSSNKLYGSLPFYFPPHIDQIILSKNSFSGSLPSFTDLHKGISIYLACNNISGLVPWADIVKVKPRAFDVSQNELQGEPTLLRDMTKLVDIRLNSNHFTGAVPYLLSCSELKILDLGNNSLHGSVPAWIGKLSQLRVLILSSNNFEGQFPPELLMLQNLHILDLSSNKLSGFLPTSFESLTVMNSQRNEDVSFLEFSLSSYGFPGSDYVVNNITTEVKLNNKGTFYWYNRNGIALMKYIDVSNNQLTGEIPDGIGGLKGLKILNMSYNHFSGKIPKSLARISELDSLDLSNNDLNGEIPPELSSLSMLGDLCLSHNNLTGRIPNEAHFETYPASSFADNPGLCGFQINKPCSDEKNNNSLGVKAMDFKDDLHYLLYWLACGLGFGFGFAIVMILLSFHAVRSRCFAVFDRIIYSTHFFILMVLARTKVLS